MLAEKLIPLSDFVTAHELSKEFDVSEKTIRNDLSYLESLLPPFELDLIKKPGMGIKIEGSKQSKSLFLNNLKRNNADDDSPEERQKKILIRVLNSKEPILIKELSFENYVSRSTIVKDLEELNKNLTDKGICLENIKTYGVVVKGSEEDKRKLISRLLSSPVHLESSFNHTARPIKHLLGEDTVEELKEVLGLDVSSIIMILHETEKHLGFTFSTEAFLNLVIHIGIAISRSQSGYPLRLSADLKEKLQENTKEFAVAVSAAKQVEENYSVHLNEDETYYILLHFMGAKMIKNNSSFDFEISIEESELEKKLRYFIRIIENELNLYLERDAHLFNNLLLHLRPTINRLQYNLSLKNPLKDEIKANYCEIYQVVSSNISYLNEAYGVSFPEDEIAYIVLHFAAAIEKLGKGIRTLVVCSSGIGMSQLIMAKVEKNFKNIDVVSAVSLFELPQYINKNIDLIITTIDIGPIEGIDTVFVSPLLNEMDIHNIKDHLKKRESSSFRQIWFSKENVYDLEGQVDKKELLEQLFESLYEKGEVTNHYLSSLEQREKMGSTYIGHGVAVVHGAMNEVKVSSLNILILEKELLWDKENKINFVINFAARQTDAPVFVFLFKKLGEIADDEFFWGKLKSLKDKEKICQYLNEVLLNDYYESID